MASTFNRAVLCGVGFTLGVLGTLGGLSLLARAASSAGLF